MENKNYYTITIALIGAAKLILNSFGVNLITDQMANDLANAIATILTVVGVIMSHIKGKPDFKTLFIKMFKKSPASVTKPTEQPKANTPIAPVKPSEMPTQQPTAPQITVAPIAQPTQTPTNPPTQK